MILEPNNKISEDSIIKSSSYKEQGLLFQKEICVVISTKIPNLLIPDLDSFDDFSKNKFQLSITVEDKWARSFPCCSHHHENDKQ